MTERNVIEIRRAQATRDGDGVAISRVVGMGHAGMDPVLMLDELRSISRDDFIGGFPPHPHRGMQTLTYMKRGGIVHEDSQGNRGEIRSGGAQYMSAGRGIIHSEMPTQDSAGLHGFQLWFNLPAAEKMDAPRYRDLPMGELAKVEGAGFRATAVSGDWQMGSARLTGPLTELAPQAALADVVLEASTTLRVAAERGETVMAYIYDGSLSLRETEQGARNLLVFGDGDTIELAAGPAGAGLLLLRGRPIGERVVHYGPFVMNSEAEIEAAIRDYQAGRYAA